MAGKRWLNIVVDGNIALQPYWHDIVSNYLENIIRSFRGSLIEEAYLGLVLYNANTELVETGFDIQFINWTKDANKFIEDLSCLTFKGNGANQCTMAEGLAEALVMYPKPSDIMPITDYYNGERHCILVAAGDPTPKRMMLCLPMINLQGNLVGQRLKAREADFLDVLSQMFPPLEISISVITPNSLPIFRAIYNLGNDVLLSNVPTSSYSNGQLTALMSKKFQYAHNALMQKNRPSTTSVESMYTTPTIPRVLTSNFQANNNSSPTCEVSIGKRMSLTSITESSSSQPLNFQNEDILTDIALESFCHPQIDVNDDTMTDLFDGRDDFAPSKRSKTKATLEEDSLNILFEPFDYMNNSIGQGESSASKTIPIEDLKAVESELGQALKYGSNQTSNVELISSSSKGVYIPASELETQISIVVEENSTRPLQIVPSNNCTFNPNLSSQNCSRSDALPQKHPPRFEQEYSTRLFQEKPMLSSENPSSSFTGLLPQPSPPSFEEQYSTTLLDDPSSYASLEPQQQHPLSVAEEYSTMLLEGVTNKSVLSPILNFENPSSSVVSIPQQHPQSVGEKDSTRLHQDIRSTLNPMFNSENPSSSSAPLVTQQHPPSVGEEYSTMLLQNVKNKSVLNFGEDYSARQLHGKTSDKSILNPMLISENSSNSNSNFAGLLSQQHFTEPLSLYHQHGLVHNPPQIITNVSYSVDTFSNTMGNSHLQFQPYSSQGQFPLPQDGSSLGPTRPMGNILENQYQSNHMASFGALNTSTFGTFNHQRNLLQVPTLDNFRDYVQTWEGYLKGKIHHNRLFIIKAKAFRSPITPPTLNAKWENKLEILNFIPEKAVNDTKNIYNPIGYVFFHVVQFNKVDLYKHLKSSNLCGKVDLSLQSIIISPTEKENYFLGTIFDRGAMFVEQH